MRLRAYVISGKQERLVINRAAEGLLRDLLNKKPNKRIDH